MLPTLGVGMESALEHDPEALLAAFRAFNRWLDDDWGFNYQDRIYAAPYITLVDVDWAVEELEYAIEHDAGVVADAPGSGVRRRAAGARPADPRTTRSGRRLERGRHHARHPRRRLELRRLRAALGPVRRDRVVPDPAAQAAALGEPDPRHDGVADRRQAVRALPEPAGRDHRDRARGGWRRCSSS